MAPGAVMMVYLRVSPVNEVARARIVRLEDVPAVEAEQRRGVKDPASSGTAILDSISLRSAHCQAT
jgi:hypothetical protein